jgi:tRNA G10  N-methylase Trm11
MVNYAFILGRKRLLSIAELCSVIEENRHIFDISEESAIISFKNELSDPQDSLNRLGGTIKIARVIAEIPKDNATIASAVSEYLIDKYHNSSKKLSYGISLHSFTENRENLLKDTLNKVKKDLESAGIKCRYINKNYKNLETAAIKGENLLEDGSEILVINGMHRYFICDTVAIQDIEGYSRRDYDRPERDPRLGMLPPKLAQLMVNLGGRTRLQGSLQSGIQVYDPFTGLGTVLMEAILLGYDAIGSDIDPEIIEKARINLTWLQKENNLHNVNIRLFAHDATDLKAEDFPIAPAMVITESYLGPPVKQVPQTAMVKKNFSHIRELLYRFFHVMNGILPADTPIVISFLAYKKADHYLYLEGLIEEIQQMGYHIDPLIPHQISSRYKLSRGDREGLIYDRQNQVVAREIWRFIKK